MINLITGLPGQGKTLRCLWLVETRRRKENRMVFYHGIKDLKLPWSELEDPKKWMDLPDGSIVVIDECQMTFRPRATGSPVPPHVSALETHRHRGFDFYLMTQHPTFIDSNVRKLTDVHEHLMRKFGAAWSTVNEWKGVKDNCDKSRADAVRTEWKFPKEVYSWYKSAEVHTTRVRVPAKVWLLVSLPFLAGAAIWLAVSSMSKVAGGSGGVTSPANDKPASAAPAPVSPGRPETGNVPDRSVPGWLAQFVPRIPDLPHTAPRYDQVTEPVRAPVVRGCWTQGDRHGCILDGGVNVRPSRAFVEQYIRDRFFIDFEASRSGETVAGLAPGSQPGAPK